MNKKSPQTNDLRDAFPVIRLSYDKRLIGSNLTALPLLGEWKCRQGAKVPTGLLKAYPEINYALNENAPTECKVTFGELEIWFDLVPFPEAGYLGMYGYHIESMVAEKMPQKLRMAG
ncbi:hypothetical protein BH11BAC2_BH11BAC2_08030 [soil metagenome]